MRGSIMVLQFRGRVANFQKKASPVAGPCLAHLFLRWHFFLLLSRFEVEYRGGCDPSLVKEAASCAKVVKRDDIFARDSTSYPV